MQLNLTLRKVSEIMQGKLISAHPDEKISSLVTDSRAVSPGDTFLALKGQKYDARQFITQVLQQGASTVIAQEDGFTIPAQAKASFILVREPLAALQALAKYHRLNNTLKVAAITGSNGKSTTKQMLLSICQTAAQTVANLGNLNNQFGVPFSLLEILPQHEFGVFELGASHPGDIAETAQLVVPDVAVLTNVSAAHLEFFHDLETVYQTKTELIRYLNFGGTLVYNADDAYLSRLKTVFKGKSISFGFSSGADLQLLPAPDFSFTYKNETYTLPLHLERHDKLNAAAATAAAIALGLYMKNIKQGLLNFTPMPMRLERLTKNGVHFILDCYNANPASMKNALDILSRETVSPRIAVLGDMKELGNSSADYHRQLAQQVIANRIDRVFLAGPEMHYAYEVLQKQTGIKVSYAPEATQWMPELKQALSGGGCCLVKASRSMHFENIVKEI